MTLHIGSNVVFSSTGARIPVVNAASRPASPVNGQIIYNANNNMMEIYDEGLWKDVVRSAAGTGHTFLLRQVITHSFVYGGYRNTSPWRNVNRMNHSTDVMQNLGDLLSSPAAYTSGACSLTRAWLWGTTTDWPGTSATTAAFNMFTETTAGAAQSMTVARGDCATVFKEFYYAWILGGGQSGVDMFNLTTEVMSSTGQTSLTGDNDAMAGCAAVCDELKAFAWGGGAAHKYTFASGTGSTLSINTSGPLYGAHSQQKGISSKVGKGYAGNEGSYNGGYNLRVMNFSTETQSTTVAKPIGNSGEENFDMGQAHQYMMGMYDGDQNNRGWKFTYATDSGSELGAGSTRTGVSGGSSGHCAWRGS